MIMTRHLPPYSGFEQGPIRPPSEADSLLIRLTRNCPWNHCTFCPVYKGTRFSLRPADHVKKDIDAIHRCISLLNDTTDPLRPIPQSRLQDIGHGLPAEDSAAFRAAYRWYLSGMETIFLQDANSLIMPSRDIIQILDHIRNRFPWAKRITSYARSHTISRIRDNDLSAIRSAGLNRIHVGMESGSDTVLDMVRKGASQKIHIEAGLKARQAGFELSEYVMPGLGGRAHSRVHAIETAQSLNRINPDFIRFRTLAIPDTVPLHEHCKTGRFQKCPDVMVAEEILVLIDHLDRITSVVQSDHILNLFGQVNGKLPDDRERMLTPLRRFLKMEPEDRCLYQAGRRLGLFADLDDMQRPRRREKVLRFCREAGITPDNVDQLTDQLMKRFI